MSDPRIILAGAVGGGIPRFTSQRQGETITMHHRLRLFTGEDEGTAVAEPGMSVKLGDITSILAEAVHDKRSWLHDFDNDEIQISTDLYEVLSAYWNLRPSA
jgi:hypothetical protein